MVGNRSYKIGTAGLNLESYQRRYEAGIVVVGAAEIVQVTWPEPERSWNCIAMRA